MCIELTQLIFLEGAAELAQKHLPVEAKDGKPAQLTCRAPLTQDCVLVEGHLGSVTDMARLKVLGLRQHLVDVTQVLGVTLLQNR